MLQHLTEFREFLLILYFSATKHTFGVNPRGILVRIREMLITGIWNLRLAVPESRLRRYYVCINTPIVSPGESAT